ncbi:uncharacterized protein [Paramisgurnus dabryanus]|uniref:uncharacterized protein n=1 Tax=Paramisgurnus dabryanus TaxID=90735 RepID=UPI003CCF0894
MEAQLEEIQQMLEKQCQLNEDLQKQNQDLKQQLQQKEIHLKELLERLNEFATTLSDNRLKRPAPCTTSTYCEEKKLSAEARKAKRESDQLRTKTRINIGRAFELWNNLRFLLGIKRIRSWLSSFWTDCPFQQNNNEVPEVRESRAAVMAPEPVPEELDIPDSRVHKSDSETAQIIKAIAKSDFLSRLDEEQINMMVEMMTSLNFCPGDEIITEGTEGDSLYIVAEGELRVMQAGRDLRTLTSGDVFGELAILYNCKRTASVKGQ